MATEANARSENIAGQDVAIDYQTGPQQTMIDFRGYAYTREPSPVSGALATRYDPTTPQIWQVPLLNTVLPKTIVKAPLAGYVVPAAHAVWVADKLTLHGIRFARVETAIAAVAVEAFRAATVALSTASFEDHTTATLTGEWKAEQRPVPAGSLFVPIAQPNARLVLALLEPQSPESLAAWGFFNNAFEQKEYMEGHVTEQVAAGILKDPAVAAAFNERLAADPAFAASPRARLDFFYRRHSSYDERLNLYPVYRTAVAP